MKTYYCWKCQINMPYLDENEWTRISQFLGNAAQEIKDYRKKNDCSLKIARMKVKPKATQMFQAITGIPDVHFEIIYHHRLIDWGPECNECGHLLRTPKASLCANCGKKSHTA